MISFHYKQNIQKLTPPFFDLEKNVYTYCVCTIELLELATSSKVAATRHWVSLTSGTGAKSLKMCDPNNRQAVQLNCQLLWDLNGLKENAFFVSWPPFFMLEY